MKHHGISRHRLPSNPKEKAFADAWEKEAHGTLGYLLCGQDKWIHDISDRDAEVAATIVQWLGSPIGQSFIDQVRDSKEYSEAAK